MYPADMRLIKSYYSDEETPWKWVGDADMRGNLSYEFEEVAVFQHEDSKDLLIAFDSGCSCPQEFGDHTDSDGEFITSLVQFDAYVAEHESMQDDWSYNPDTEDYEKPVDPTRYPDVVDQVVALRKRVESLLSER